MQTRYFPSIHSHRVEWCCVQRGQAEDTRSRHRWRFIGVGMQCVRACFRRRKPFWVDESLTPLAKQYFSKRRERILWNNLPIADIKAIRWKDADSIGFSPMLIRISLPLHQSSGDCWDSTRILVNISARKGWHAGRFHGWWYEMRSSPGDELLTHDLRVLLISSGVVWCQNPLEWTGHDLLNPGWQA